MMMYSVIIFFLPDSAVKALLVSPSVTGYSALFACIAMFIRKRDGSKFVTFEQITNSAMIFAKADTGYVSFGRLCGWGWVRNGIVFLISISIGWVMMSLFPDPFLM
ncbi:MAG: hypothetical protein LIO57_07995 [Oscillospiraceae bacterium]|nr:hypothetical protein [Oscillospiraceae bacterium]